jgi:ribosomal protein L11 methylase PrmA
VRELVQVVGEGFGAEGHATTAMCLELLPLMPDGPAYDAGCGSGLLGQAWAATRRGPVVGCDLDARALAHADASLIAAGLSGWVTLRHGPLEAILPDELAGAVLLANIPAQAHRLLARRARSGAPRGAVLSGLRPREVDEIVASWTARGLRTVRITASGGFCAVALRPG